MKILEPIPQHQIPKPGDKPRSDPHKYRAIYRKVLALNGSALPVQFFTRGEAFQFGNTCMVKHGSAHRLGIQAAVRGDTVFLYKKS